MKAALRVALLLLCELASTAAAIDGERDAVGRTHTGVLPFLVFGSAPAQPRAGHLMYRDVVVGMDSTITIVGLLTFVSAFVLALIVSVLQATRDARKSDLRRLFLKADRVIAARRKPRSEKVIDLVATMYVAMEEAKDTGTVDPDTFRAYQERARGLFDILENSMEPANVNDSGGRPKQ